MKRRITLAFCGLVAIGAGIAAAAVAADQGGTTMDVTVPIPGGETRVTTAGDPETGLEISVTAAKGRLNRWELILLDSTDGSDEKFKIRDKAAGATVADGEYCTQVGPRAVACEGEIESIDGDSLDGADRLSFSFVSCLTCNYNAIVVDAGEGNDLVKLSLTGDNHWSGNLLRLIGGQGHDTFNLAGPDATGLGRLGNDSLRGGAGGQRLFGGAGRDLLAGGAGDGDLCDGGRNRDRKGPGCEMTRSIP